MIHKKLLSANFFNLNVFYCQSLTLLKYFIDQTTEMDARFKYYKQKVVSCFLTIKNCCLADQ